MYIAETGLPFGLYKSSASVKDSNDSTDSTEEVTEQTASDDATDSETVDSTSSDFAAFMQQALGKSTASQVSEEELFAGLIEQRLGKISQEAADYYAAEKSKLAVTMLRTNGTTPWEDVAKAALKATVESGKIDRAQADQVNGEAFTAAQLDDTLDALYDDRGGADDPTIAVSNMEAALLKLRTTVDKLDSGELTVEPRDIDLPSNSGPASVSSSGASSATSSSGFGSSAAAQAADGAGGFVWKPISDSNGKLVVLVPSDLAGEIDSLEVHSDLPATEATKLAEGRYDGETNGGRPTFRFDKAGSEFGENLHVVVFKDDGSQITYDIEDGATRVD